jgi:hypothetical protein
MSIVLSNSPKIVLFDFVLVLPQVVVDQVLVPPTH